MSGEIHVIDCDADPFVLDTGEWGEEQSCSVEEHRKGGRFIWDPTRVKLYLSEGQGSGQHIRGDVLRRELQSQPVLNANVLNYLRRPENSSLVPEDWRDGRQVFFWGTIYREADGDLCVLYLRWFGKHWGYGHRLLKEFFDSDCYAAVRADVGLEADRAVKLKDG